jgi:hypothetical protein
MRWSVKGHGTLIPESAVTSRTLGDVPNHTLDRGDAGAEEVRVTVSHSLLLHPDPALRFWHRLPHDHRDAVSSQVISHFSNLDGLPQQIMMIGSSGSITRPHLRHFNTNFASPFFAQGRRGRAPITSETTRD